MTYFALSPREHHPRVYHSSDPSSEARLKLVAESSQDAAKLLLQVRRIAADELNTRVVDNVRSGPLSTVDRGRRRLVHPVTPVLPPRATLILPNDISLNAEVRGVVGTRFSEDTHAVTPTNYRCRTVSFRSQDVEEGSFSSKEEQVFDSITSSESLVRQIDACMESVLPKPSEDDDDLSSLEDKTLEGATTSTASNGGASHKFVGESLPPGVTLRDVLRKKFSWKSFPELETYLVDHRHKYLECSNAMNYTKAQKAYNNQLTQGLLDLAAREGYLFDGFTFAAVRDRIRCFYKSFVQATKKKKRVKVYKQRGRSMTV